MDRWYQVKLLALQKKFIAIAPELISPELNLHVAKNFSESDRLMVCEMSYRHRFVTGRPITRHEFWNSTSTIYAGQAFYARKLCLCLPHG